MGQGDYAVRAIDDRIRRLIREELGKARLSAVSGGGYSVNPIGTGGVPTHNHDILELAGYPADADLFLDGAAAFVNPGGQLLATPVMTDADIKALGHTDFELIPSPGAGKMIVADLFDVASMVVRSHCVSDYATLDVGPLRVSFGPLSTTVFADLSATQLLQPNAAFSVQDVIAQTPSWSAGGGMGPENDFLDQALTASLPSQISGDLTAGNAGNTLAFWIWYRVLAI